MQGEIVMLDIVQIMELLPHRYPFLLVDKIIEMEPGKRIVGIKNVTMNEPFFQGHFPGFPVMPGVLIIEAMAQVAALLAYCNAAGEAKEKVRASVVAKEAKSIARQKAEETLKTIKEEWARAALKEFPAIAKNLGLEISQTPVFTRGQYLPKIGISGDFQEAAFQLTEENSISDTVETANGYCILHLDAYTPADEKAYEKERETLRTSILKERKAQAFNDFLSRLRVKAKVISHIPQKDTQI